MLVSMANQSIGGLFSGLQNIKLQTTGRHMMCHRVHIPFAKSDYNPYERTNNERTEKVDSERSKVQSASHKNVGGDSCGPKNHTDLWARLQRLVDSTV